MWLEELAWVWLPILGAVAVWLAREHVRMKAQLRNISERLERLESATQSGRVTNAAQLSALSATTTSGWRNPDAESS
jgi:TRAP-type C4-dicarboxylate transport system permease small subunit